MLRLLDLYPLCLRSSVIRYVAKQENLV